MVLTVGRAAQPPSSPAAEGVSLPQPQASAVTTAATTFPTETVAYLQAWTALPKHADNPFPTEQEMVQIMADTGITNPSKLTRWFVNKREQYWISRVEATAAAAAAAANVGYQHNAAYLNSTPPLPPPPLLASSSGGTVCPPAAAPPAAAAAFPLTMHRSVQRRSVSMPIGGIGLGPMAATSEWGAAGICGEALSHSPKARLPLKKRAFRNSVGNEERETIESFRNSGNEDEERETVECSPRRESGTGTANTPSHENDKETTTKHRLCSTEGCKGWARFGGVCIQHSSAKRKITCKFEGCTNHAKKGGVCIRHGAKVATRKRCSTDGCNNYVVQGGVCKRHGARVRICSHEGCKSQARTEGLCVAHGGTVKRCKMEGCTRQAMKGGVCVTHGAKRKLCSTEGCKNQSVVGGVCVRHGGLKRKGRD